LIIRIIIAGCIIIGLTVQICVGQLTFQQAYGKSGNDKGYSVSATNDAGYIITGEYDVTGLFSAQVYLAKIDSAGSLTWTKTYGGAAELKTKNGSGNRGYGVVQTYDGGYIIGGEVHAFGAGGADMYLIKTDLSGDIAWSKTIGGSLDDYCYSIQETTDSSFIIAGSTESFGVGITNAYLVKVSSIGDTLWTRIFGDSSVAGAYDVKETLDKGFIITGYTFSTPEGKADIFLIKTNANGDIMWQKSYGGSLHEFAYAVSQTTDGGYVVVGSTESYAVGIDDVFLIKTDSVGNLLWSNSYGGPDYEEGKAVIQLYDKGFLIVGYTRSFGAGREDAYAIRTDSLGAMMWSKVYGGPNDEIGHDVTLSGDGGYIITGKTTSFGVGSSDLYIIKIDSLGESGCYQFSTATTVNSDTASVNLLTFQTGYGTIVTNPPTIVGSTITVQTDICDSNSAINELDHQFIKIYPSPASNFLHIEQSSGSDADITIYNSMGQAVYVSLIKAHLTEVINISKYPQGLYYLSILTLEAKMTKKILFINFL